MSLLFFSKEVVELWTNEDSFGGYLLFFSLGFYGYILSYVTTYATVIWSLNKAKKTLFVAWGEAILNLILSIILIQFLGIGGVALATAFSSLLTGFVFLPKMLKKMTDGGVSYDFSYMKNQFYFLVMPFITIAVLSIFIQDIKLKIFLFFLSVALYILSTSFVLTKEDKMIFWNVLNKIKRR
jgi:putative peptidoglycan lipid II flippase